MLFLAYMFIFLIVAIGLFAVAMYVLEATGFNRRRKAFKMNIETKMESLNTPYNCNCGITSRKYQLKNDSDCPHCGEKIYLFSKKVKDKRYPFAPKLTKWEVKQYVRNQEELERIEVELRELKSYDAEIQIWEDMQRKKVEEQKAIIEKKQKL